MRFSLLVLFVALLVLAGCGGDEDTPTPTKTPVPTFTPTVAVDVVAPTDTPMPMPTATPTEAPAATATDVPLAPVATATDVPLAPAATPTPEAAKPSANGDANLRAGPGTGYAVVGQAQAGQALEIVARNGAGDWYQLAGGAWLAAFLVVGAPGDLPVVLIEPPATPLPAVVAPTSPPSPAQPAATQPSPITSAPNIALLVLVNQNKSEVIGIRNDGNASVDIGGWRLDGSKGDNFCIVPGATILQSGEMFTVATGDSQPQGRGVKCGDGNIWNNDGEIIFLHSTDGQVFQVQT